MISQYKMKIDGMIDVAFTMYFTQNRFTVYSYFKPQISSFVSGRPISLTLTWNYVNILWASHEPWIHRKCSRFDEQLIMGKSTVSPLLHNQTLFVVRQVLSLRQNQPKNDDSKFKHNVCRYAADYQYRLSIQDFIH